VSHVDGAGVIIRSSWWGCGACSLSSSVPAIVHLLYLTCKQVLAALGMGGASVLSVFLGLCTSVRHGMSTGVDGC
jgi:hypothetical protein